MSLPFALSLSKYVNSTGTDVGFASLLGVALLALLYFAGARETRTLRDQLEEAHERITSLEARLAQSLRNQAARVAAPQPAVPGRPGVVPAPALAGSAMGTALARVQREVAQAEASPEPVEATMAMAAPALGSATRLISLPQVVAEPVPVPAMGAATAAGAAYAGTDDDEFDDEFGPEDTMFVPAGQTAAAANGGANGSGGAAVAAPPRVQLYDDQAEAAGPPPRRTIPTVDTGPSRSRMFIGRLGGTIAAVVVVAVIVVALLVITSSGGTHHARKTASGTGTRTTSAKRVPLFTPAKVKVSVLNGTGLTGLAQDVGDKLMTAGYKVPAAAVTNDGSEQQLASTTVSYRTGYGNAAVHIADALHTDYGIALPQTMPASAAAITNCGTPDTTGVAGTCPANVIVSVGNDLSGAANSSSSG